MTISNIKSIIHDIESRFPVDNWLINGIHIWPIIRFTLNMDFSNKLFINETLGILEETIPIKKITKTLERIKNPFKFLFAYIRDHKKNSKLRLTDAIFLSNGISFNKVKNYWYDILCDPFIDYFKNKNFNCLKLTPVPGYFIPRYNSSKFIYPYILVISWFVSKFKKPLNEILPNFLDFLDYLELKKYGIPKISLNSIRKEIILIRMIANFFKKIFLKTKPSLGFVANYNGILGYAFNLACREFGISSIDIQHGCQGDLHLAYGSWSKVPEKGYELLPSIFWCWSDFEANALQKWCKRVNNWHKPIIGGNLWLNQWFYDKPEFVLYYDGIISKIKESNKNLKHILFTQSEPIESESFKNILNVINNSPSSWFWWVRIHPCDLKIRPKVKKILYKNKISNFNIDYATELPLYALLRNIDIHITCCSSTVIEAEIFSIPSVIVSKYGNELFPRQISSGWAVSAYMQEDIIKAINHQLDALDKLKQYKDKNSTRKEEDKLDYLIELLNKTKRLKNY